MQTRKRFSFESDPDLICFWDFQENAGNDRVSTGHHGYRLVERSGPIKRVDDGVIGRYAMHLDEGQWLTIDRADCPALNIEGHDAQVSVLAWIKRGKTATDHCEAIVGMWDETRRKRQYCLFLNLRIWESAHQVCGHISAVGGATPGYKWCMDASIGHSTVPIDKWQFVAFTYDGTQAISYLNGNLDSRNGRNPYVYEGGIFVGGDDGSDFTVGGVSRSGEMGNWFTGAIGGIAVFKTALPPATILQIHREVPLPE